MPRAPRPPRKPSRRAKSKSANGGALRLYGLHAVRAALENENRSVHMLQGTANALARLGTFDRCPVKEVESAELDRLVGRDAVHQGIVLECDPLERLDGSELFHLADARLVLVLDQVTDPHNVGAILRSAVALGVDAVLVTSRHAAPETGVLAKAASGALDMVEIGEVRNLSKAIGELRDLGLYCVGLDSEGEADLADLLPGPAANRIAIVLGAEGRGLREQTREACDALARLDMPGRIRSLNVSNAAALALYLSRKRVDS